ncbi:hypothetical protein K502DRAFT_323486 [Neoconidiobolus thromboides FSU 785]|nr:hypothetical protein K502DRAFT_323486 [Neoconidiobolus thromboides FSU 785]
MLGDQKDIKNSATTTNSSEDDLVARLEALLALPSSKPISIPAENLPAKRKGNVSIYTDKYRDSKGEFINFKPRESAQYDYEGSINSIPLSAKSSIVNHNPNLNPNQRLSINTSCFGRKSVIEKSLPSPVTYTLQPLEPIPDKLQFNDFAHMEIYDSKVNPVKKEDKEKVTKKTSSIGLNSKTTSTSSFNPGEVFNRDEISGDFIKKGKKDIINEWVDEMEESSSKPSVKIQRNSSKYRLLSRSKPTFLKKMHRKQPVNEDSMSENKNVYNTASSFNLIEAKVSKRDKEWHMNYLAKRNQIDKIIIPPRDSSLIATKQILERYKDSKILHKHSKPSFSSKVTKSSEVKFVEDQLNHNNTDKASLASSQKRDPFDIKITYGVQSNFKLNEIGDSPTSNIVMEQKRISLPHFRTLLRKRRQPRIRKRSIKPMAHKPQF